MSVCGSTYHDGMRYKPWIALAVGLVVGFLSATAIQQLLDGMRRSWSKRTAAYCASISAALEEYRAEKGDYPPLDGNVEHLSRYLAPRYLRHLPTRDMSDQPYLVVLNGSKAAVISVGVYGAAVEEKKLIRGGIWLK